MCIIITVYVKSRFMRLHGSDPYEGKKEGLKASIIGHLFQGLLLIKFLAVYSYTPAAAPINHAAEDIKSQLSLPLLPNKACFPLPQ